jgi:hypothetical protein
VTAGSLEKQQYKCLTLNNNWRVARRKEMLVADDADDDGFIAREECYHIALSTVPVRWLSATSFLFLAVVVLGYGYQVIIHTLQLEFSSFCFHFQNVLFMIDWGSF